MFKTSRVIAATAVALLAAACGKSSDDASTPATPVDTSGFTTDQQRFGYSVGVNIGHQLKEVKGDIDVKTLEQGFEDSLNDVTPKLDDKAREEILKSMGAKIQQRKADETKAKAEKAKTDGAAFLEENAKKPGMKITADGLQYEVVQEGTGATPNKDDTVTVNYKGTLINGTVFDSSYDRNQPLTLPVAGVIPGWSEGLQLMKVGGKYKLYVPSALAYGERQVGPKIGPNETLIFEVELVSIQKPGDKPAPTPPPKKAS